MPRSKYTHHRHATATKPSAAVVADAARQSVSAVPSATATTDSPRTMMVNRAKRSGTWLGSTGIRAWMRWATTGIAYSIASPTPHST
jgi:hypothetical protein